MNKTCGVINFQKKILKINKIRNTRKLQSQNHLNFKKSV